MEERNEKLHAVMVPWLAMGHLLPCFELSKRLAMKGLQISIFTTPGNIRRLPPVPPRLTPLLNFVPCPLPTIQNLPSHIENTTDLRSEAERPLLVRAYTQLEHGLAAFLADHLRPKPDWIIFDAISSSWVPPLAARFGLSCAMFSIFSAAVLAFLGLSPAYDSPEELTLVPDYIPFPTSVALRLFEARQAISVFPKKSTPSSCRPEYFPQCDMFLVRTCREFEDKWLDLIAEIHANRHPVIPVGVLPPFVEDYEISEAWVRISEWLDEREERSVVYAAFGTEANLTREQVGEVADGLERSGLPFLWTLRGCSPPQGFEERNAGRGLVFESWVPQALILAHPAVGGFLNQAGWSSVVEGLSFGVNMAVLPMVFDQGVNARNFVESGVAVEVPRNAEDGNFSGEEIARTLKMVMKEEEGEEVRARVRAVKSFFGSEKIQAEYMDEVVKNLWNKRKTRMDKQI
nr:putative glycosyltransferase [Anoectochilus roxburghii]